MALEDGRLWCCNINQLRCWVSDHRLAKGTSVGDSEDLQQPSDTGSQQPEHSTVEPTTDLELRGALQMPLQIIFKPTEGIFAILVVVALGSAHTASAVSQPVVPAPLVDSGRLGVIGAGL